jgi:biotin carboxyl carrier protein
MKATADMIREYSRTFHGGQKMKVQRKSVREQTASISKIIVGTSVLAVILTACGGGNTVDKNPNTAPESTQEVTQGQTTPPASAPATSEPTGTAFTHDNLPQELQKGNFKEVYARFSPELKQALTEENLVTGGTELTKGFDVFQPSSALQLNGMDQRVWTNSTASKGLIGIFDDKDSIAGLQVVDLKTYPDTDKARTSTVFSPPFREDLLVFWGGTNVLSNYHYEYEGQRYAFDLVQENKQFSYNGDPLKNESYYAFGKEIIAPADGTVVSVFNDTPDNEPVGVMNEKVPAGNLVVIDHGGKEFSYLAHLKKGSIKVKPGDKVKTGDFIGLLGNSGNSSEPHLHFQVSDGPDLFEAKSLRIQWKGDLSPAKGDTIKVQP